MANKNPKKPKPTQLNGPDGLHLTSIGNADRFLREHGKDLRWVEGASMNSAGTFYHWDGMRWQPNNSKAVELSQKTVRDLDALLVLALKKQQPTEQLEELVRFWRSSESDYKVREILALARGRLVINRGEFDADPDLLGVKNGVIDLRTCIFRASVREDLLTKQCNVLFNEDARCPIWENFVAETAGGDAELIRYLRQCAGVTLTGHQKEHLFFIVVGPAGTGKTTFHEALQFVIGDYGCGIDPNSLSASAKLEGGRPRPDIAKLAGMRFVFANESRAGLKLDEGLVKALTGGDSITGRHLYEHEFDFIPQLKLWLRTNNEPQFDGADTGMQRRIVKVPFICVVEKKDLELPAKLKQEAPGILNWALVGLQDYQQHGLIEPAVVRRVTDEYIQSLDVVGQFLAERCERSSQYQVGANDLYHEYVLWMTGQDQQRPVGIKRFKSDVGGRRGLEHKHTKAGNLWYGIRLLGLPEWKGVVENSPTIEA